MKTLSATQYMRPDGRQKSVTFTVSDEIALMAEGMDLSCEILMNGVFAGYAIYPDEDEENESIELGTNGSGDRDPQKTMEKVIKTKYEERG